jgi:hypothetical protein
MFITDGFIELARIMQVNVGLIFAGGMVSYASLASKR